MQHWFDEPFESAPTLCVAPHASSQPHRIDTSRHTRRRPMMVEDFALTPLPNAERRALVVVAGPSGLRQGHPMRADRERSSGSALLNG